MERFELAEADEIRRIQPLDHRDAGELPQVLAQADPGRAGNVELLALAVPEIIAIGIDLVAAIEGDGLDLRQVRVGQG